MTAMVFALLGAFLAAVVAISITPLRELTQDLAVCRNADRIERGTSDSAPVRGPRGQPQATETVEMTCFYDSGSVKSVGNDSAVLGGIGVSVLAGILLGGLPVLLSRLVPRRRST